LIEHKIANNGKPLLPVNNIKIFTLPNTGKIKFWQFDATQNTVEKKLFPGKIPNFGALPIGNYVSFPVTSDIYQRGICGLHIQSSVSIILELYNEYQNCIGRILTVDLMVYQSMGAKLNMVNSLISQFAMSKGIAARARL
jgi:hypothetical protein